MGKPQLGYWNIRGLVQTVKFALAYMEVDYEDVQFQDKEGDDTWTNTKPTLGMTAPNLPYLIDGSVKLSESQAILKYLIRKNKPALIPSDITKLTITEQVEGIISDINQRFAMSVYTDTEMANNFFEQSVPGKLECLVKFLGDNKFILGNDVCYVDFFIYETLYRLKTFRPKYLESHKTLLNYVENFEKIPQIAKYISSPAYIKAPCYSRHAVKQI